MKKNILLRTNFLVCLIIVVGFCFTAVLSYQANYTASLQNVEQVSGLTSEGVYYQISNTFLKPVNVSLTMANDSLLKDLLTHEMGRLSDASYVETIRNYLEGYREKYQFDSVFLVSTATGRYYNFNGLDRVLVPGEAENRWFYQMLQSPDEYAMNVDNDEVKNADNDITVFVNCKIRGEKGAVLGVVGVGLRIDSLQQLLQSYEAQFGVSAFLVDQNGDIEISSLHTGYEAVSLFDIYPLWDERAKDAALTWRTEGEALSFWTENPGEDGNSYVVTRFLPELDWRLVVVRDTGAILAELTRRLGQTVLIILLIITAILLIITAVIRSFNRKIVELTQSVEQERRTMFERATEELFDNIYELDITHNRPANQVTEQYFESLGAPPGTPFDKSLHIVAQKQIKEEFRQGYIDTFSPENVLRAYREGQDTLRYDFMISTGGDYYWMRIIARVMQWEGDGSIHMLTYRQNIDAEKRQEVKMRAKAQMDEMTGLLTKTNTQRGIDALLQRHPERSCAFFIFDIDNFKQVNDRFGHAFGDRVIVDFTSSIRSAFGPEAVTGRIGGDEFAAFVPAPDEAWVREQARSLSASLNRFYREEGIECQVTASIGVALSPRDGTGFDTLYQKADSALYETKKRGRNDFTVYTP